MKLIIHGNNVSITGAMEEKIETKFNFLNTYLKEDDIVEVNIHKDSRFIRMLIIVPELNGEKLLIRESDESFYKCVDLVHERLKVAFKKNREKMMNSRKRHNRISKVTHDINRNIQEETPAMEEESLAAIQLKYGL
mgnify:CR=1 FL=1